MRPLDGGLDDLPVAHGERDAPPLRARERLRRDPGRRGRRGAADRRADRSAGCTMRPLDGGLGDLPVGHGERDAPLPFGPASGSVATLDATGAGARPTVAPGTR